MPGLVTNHVHCRKPCYQANPLILGIIFSVKKIFQVFNLIIKIFLFGKIFTKVICQTMFTELFLLCLQDSDIFTFTFYVCMKICPDLHNL